MSAKAIQQWLVRHEGVIPAYDHFHDRVTRQIRLGVASQAEIADIIMLDPGMASTLLHRVNSRLKKSRRPGIATIHTAFGHLGKPAVNNIIGQHLRLEDTQLQPSSANCFRQLLNQSHHALMQLELFASMQGIGTVEDMRMAVLLHNIGEVYACLHDPDLYQQYVKVSKAECDSKNTANKIFGFTFMDLSRTLAYNWNLPELLIESLDQSHRTGRKAHLVRLAAGIAHQSEFGWYHKAMFEMQKNCNDYLDCKLPQLVRCIHNTAVIAARSSPVKDVLHPAARLIMLPDQKTVASQKPKPGTPLVKRAVRPPLPDQIEALLKVPDTNQSEVLSLLLSGLQQDAGFSCTALMLLNADKTRLAMRKGTGIEPGSALSKLQIELKQSGLLKSLLQKPQALNVTSNNYKNYQSMLPGPFKAACMCDNFVLMSVFIGSNPIGLIYCDRQKTERPIDEHSYQLFKSSVMMASRALAFLAKRNTRSAA